MYTNVTSWEQTTGFCLDCDGGRELKSRVASGSGVSEADCIQRCSEFSGVTGCEHGGRYNECYIYKGNVSRGSKHTGVKCWVSPTNCPQTGKARNR